MRRGIWTGRRTGPLGKDTGTRAGEELPVKTKGNTGRKRVGILDGRFGLLVTVGQVREPMTVKRVGATSCQSKRPK